MITDRTSIAVISNPGTAADQADRLGDLLAAEQTLAEWLETTTDDPGLGQTRKAIAGGAGLIIACGGDGTVRACVEGAAGTEAAVAIIPAGTGNLLARNLGIPMDVDDAFAIARRGIDAKIDVGYANDEAFAVMAGIGLDARIMRDTDREAKNRFGVVAYATTALAHLRDERFSGSLTVDGRQLWAGQASSILVGNHGELQGGVALFPDASAEDGVLEALVTTADGLGEWLRAAWAVVRDDPAAGPIQRFSGSSLVVRTTVPVPYEIDGEERPATDEIAFRVDRDAVTVMIPKGERS